MDPAILAALSQGLTGNTASGSPDGAGLTVLVQAIAKMLADDDDDGGNTKAKESELALRRRRAWKRLSHIQRTMSLMAKRNAFVAGALGACECWGADVSCARCRGAGSPGTFEPVPSAYETLVVPLLRRRAGMLRERIDRERAEMSNQDAAVQ
jgi:hypothetical protein